MTRLVVASANPGKLAELAALLAPRGLEVIGQGALGVEPAAELAPTFLENALAKARHAAQRTGLAALADDSGLLVDALGGAPGVRSARFAGPRASDAENCALLLERLAGVEAARRGAQFYCVLVLLRGPDDPAPLVCEGRWRGRIAERPRGAGGFGYDPLFVDPRSGRTAAELAPAEKNARSHRGRALRALARRLRAAGGL